MGKPPAFQFYASDFDMDTASWTCTQVGIYIRLLMYEWVNGSIPSRVSDLARIARIDVRNMQRLWPAVLAKKFVPLTNTAGTEMLINPRLEREREKQQNYRKSQEESGRRGGIITQEKRRNMPSEPSSKPSSENKALQSSSSNNTIPYSEIVSYLNLKTGKSFKHTTKETQRFIKARFKSGFTVEDFFTVIDNQSGKWLSKPDMIDYLRPETLFGTKFESYLQTKPAEPEVKYEYLGMPG